jgi:dihydrofolate reductase
MILSLIAALDDKRGIGRGGSLPWHLSTDLQRFKALTLGHHLIMGRKTFLSIRRPLQGRTNIVVTRQKDYLPEGVVVAHSVKAALETAKKRGETEVFFIGGGEIFEQVLPLADRLYLTHVNTDSGADVFFPELDQSWKIILSEEIPVDEKNEYSSIFRVYERT